MTTISREELLLRQAKAMPEKELQALVTKAAQTLGWKTYHTWSSLHSGAGFPDIVALRDGRGIVAELKREGKEPTADQWFWLEAFTAIQGFRAFVWTPTNWLSGEIMELLK